MLASHASGGVRTEIGQEVLHIVRQSGVWHVEITRDVFEAPVLVNVAGRLVADLILGRARDLGAQAVATVSPARFARS